MTSAPQPRDKVDAGEAARASRTAAMTQSTMQVDQLARLAFSRAAPSNDARYVKFVDAVRALRVDLDLSTLSRAQIDRIIASAERLYLINDGVPEPVEPEPIDPNEVVDGLKGHMGPEDTSDTPDDAVDDRQDMAAQTIAPAPDTDSESGEPDGEGDRQHDVATPTRPPDDAASSDNGKQASEPRDPPPARTDDPTGKPDSP